MPVIIQLYYALDYEIKKLKTALAKGFRACEELLHNDQFALSFDILT